MEKNSNSDFLAHLQSLADKGKVPHKFHQILRQFYTTYVDAAKGYATPEHLNYLFETFLKLLQEQFESPFSFQPYHEQICSPFDYYTFGLDMLRPLANYDHSSAHQLENADLIEKYIKEGHNVVLLSNHQTEADPQAISLLLEKTHPNLAKNMIFVAGERVITDPLAIPFSMGRNLLCIYSKKYIDNPPEQKLKKQLHNKRTMELMSELLAQGGICIYVAPSGGRDRPNEKGVVEIALFDPQSIEMFYLMSKRAKKPTHFFTLSLLTYDFLPPPDNVQIELGESRKAKRASIYLSFGKEIDMEHFPGNAIKDKYQRRQARADFIYAQVKTDYHTLETSHES